MSTAADWRKVVFSPVTAHASSAWKKAGPDGRGYGGQRRFGPLTILFGIINDSGATSVYIRTANEQKSQPSLHHPALHEILQVLVILL